MDNNQKLVSQIADLSRNLNTVSNSLKKNTEGIQSLLESRTDSRTSKIPQEISFSEITKELKDISSTLSKMNSADSAFSKIANSMDRNENKSFDFSNKNVKGSFQTGGVAKEDGNYVVGENGKEIVTLPKGAGVIPINTKDLIDGLRKVPELSNLLKDSDTIYLTGDISNYNRAVLSPDGKRMSLSRLIEKYEDKSADLESDTKNTDTNKKMLDVIEGYLSSLSKLESSSDSKVQDELKLVSTERQNLKKDISETGEDLVQKEKLVKDITKDLPPSEISDLAIAKAYLQAEKTLLSKKSKSEQKEDLVNEKKSESVITKTDLKKSASTEETKKSPSIFDKVSKSAARVGEGVAEKTGLGGVLNVAKKGLLSLSKNFKTEASVTTTPTKPIMAKNIGKLSPQPPKPEIKPEPPVESKPVTPSSSSKKSESTVQTNSVNKKDVMKSDKSSVSPESSSDRAEITSNDLKEIKSGLARLATILEGTLTVSNIDGPFRPDSRRI